MSPEKTYPGMIYHAASKDSFLELYDALSIDKVELRITKYDPTKQTNKVTDRASYYLEPAELLALGKLAASGQLNNVITTGSKAFPAVRFGIPKSGDKMRQWQMSGISDRGNFQITLTEKERKERWDDPDAKQLNKASFYVSPFSLVVMATKLEMYISSLSRPESSAPKEPGSDAELTFE